MPHFNLEKRETNNENGSIVYSSSSNTAGKQHHQGEAEIERKVIFYRIIINQLLLHTTILVMRSRSIRKMQRW